jgi:hypothetical protein
VNQASASANETIDNALVQFFNHRAFEHNAVIHFDINHFDAIGDAAIGTNKAIFDVAIVPDRHGATNG